MTHGKCDYAGCHTWGEQIVSFALDRWEDVQYCEEHALEEVETGWYTIKRATVSTDG